MRIAVCPRKEYRHIHDARYIYFENKPSQDDFDEEYELFLSGTHHVHVHNRVWQEDWNNWDTITITDEFCSWRHHGCGCFGDEFDNDPEWRQPLARFRLKFKNSGQINGADFRYVYFLNKPRDEKISEYERRHHVVMIELRDNVLRLNKCA